MGSRGSMGWGLRSYFSYFCIVVTKTTSEVLLILAHGFWGFGSGFLSPWSWTEPHGSGKAVPHCIVDRSREVNPGNNLTVFLPPFVLSTFPGREMGPSTFMLGLPLYQSSLETWTRTYQRELTDALADSRCRRVDKKINHFPSATTTK